MPNLSNWPVSRRLFAVIVLALVMGLAFGGLRIYSAESSAAQFGRVSQLATLGQRLSVLIQDLQDERDITLSNLALSDVAPLAPYYARTNTAARAVQSAAAGIGGAFPVNIQGDVKTVEADIQRIQGTGSNTQGTLHATLNPSAPQDELAVIANYDADIKDMINLAGQVAQGVSDASLTSDVGAFNALALAKEQVSEQRALLNYSFSNPADATPANVAVDPNTELALQIASQEEFSDESAFQQVATPAERAFLASALASNAAATSVAAAQNIETNVVGNPGQSLGLSVLGAEDSTSVNPTAATLHQGQLTWDAGMGDYIDALQKTETLLADNIATRAGQLHAGAQQSALITGVITVAVLLLVLFAALLVARSLVLPLRRLRGGALNIASAQLPERVRLLSESPDAAASMEVAPINVASEDEIGQVARAFDQVHAEAVRLAGEQALLRTSFNAMFVNLSRRTQSLNERLARMIDTLEQNEDDPDRLGSLFAMDHLVTRMRRNSENLLLLAGHENPRKWSEPVPIADVARAATSEIEQYNRVVLNNVPSGISIIGPAVSDVVHLLAELIENATIFSPKDTQVTVSAQELSSGGVLIEILDKGIGVSEARLADMNWRLDNPPTIDVSVSRHMGLFAVARLAERHRVRVRLRPATPQGLSALVWLPDSVIERTGRYGSVGGWSSQPTGAQSAVGAMGGRTFAGIGTAANGMIEPETTATLAQNGYSGNGGSGYGNGMTAQSGRASSGWFRTRGARGLAGSAPGIGSGNGGGTGGTTIGTGTSAGLGTNAGGIGAMPGWGSNRTPADIVAEPAYGDTTAAGLPVRVPKANLIPGGGSGTQPSPVRVSEPDHGSLPTRTPGSSGQSLPQRSPDETRSLLSGFQRGTRRAETEQAQSGPASRPGEGGDR